MQSKSILLMVIMMMNYNWTILHRIRKGSTVVVVMILCVWKIKCVDREWEGCSIIHGPAMPTERGVRCVNCLETGFFLSSFF